MRGVGACALIVCVLGCEAAPDEPLPLAELAAPCGEPEPVQVMALEPDAVAMYPVSTGDRVLALVHDTIDDAQDPESGRIVSVDRCGGDARVVLDLGAIASPPEDPRAPVLARGYLTDALYFVDPLGVHASQLLGNGYVIGEGDGVRYVALLDETEDETATEEAESATLHRVVVGDDGVALQPVLEGLSPVSAHWTGQGPGPTAVVLTLASELLAVDLATGTTSPLAAPVQDYAVAPDPRFVLYQVPRDYASDSLFEPWYVLDRDTGVHTFLSNFRTAGFDGPTARAEQFDADGNGHTHVLMLPGLHAHALAGWWATFLASADGRVVATRLLPVIDGLEAEFWVFDTPDAQPHRLPFRGRAVPMRVDPDGLYIVAREGADRLLRLPLDGSPAVTVAAHVTPPHWLPDGRFLTVRELDDGSIGDLVVYAGSRPALVEEDVYGDLYLLNVKTDPASGAFFFQVRDDDRRGLFLAELAP